MMAPLSPSELRKKLNTGFEHGDLALVKIFLTTPGIKEEVESLTDYGFTCACDNGYFEMVQFLLTSPELSKHANIHEREDYGFRTACCDGNLELVQYLLTSPELSEHCNVHALDDEGIIWACNFGQLDVVQYLLTSTDLKEHANIHAREDKACKEERLDVIEFLLYELQFKVTPETNAALVAELGYLQYPKIKALIDKSSLYFNLDKQLIHTAHSEKTKI